MNVDLEGEEEASGKIPRSYSLSEPWHDLSRAWTTSGKRRKKKRKKENKGCPRDATPLSAQ